MTLLRIGVTVSVAVLVAPPKLAEIVARVLAVTDFVAIVNVALAAPAGTVTLAGGTAAAVFEEISVTTAPPVGAAFVRTTDPTEFAVPVTDVGERLSELSVGEFVTESAAVFVTPA